MNRKETQTRFLEIINTLRGNLINEITLAILADQKEKVEFPNGFNVVDTENRSFVYLKSISQKGILDIDDFEDEMELNWLATDDLLSCLEQINELLP